MILGRNTKLRALELSDAATLFEIAGDPTVSMDLGKWELPHSLKAHEDWIAQQASQPDVLRLAILDSNDLVVGITGFSDINLRDSHAEHFIKVSSEAAGRGIGSDAIKTCCAYAFSVLGLHKVLARILVFNEASLKAYAGNCGFRVEGTERDHVFRGNRFHDAVLVSLLRDEFFKLDEAEEYVNRLTPESRMDRFPIPDDWKA